MIHTFKPTALPKFLCRNSDPRDSKCLQNAFLILSWYLWHDAWHASQTTCQSKGSLTFSFPDDFIFPLEAKASLFPQLLVNRTLQPLGSFSLFSTLFASILLRRVHRCWPALCPELLQASITDIFLMASRNKRFLNLIMAAEIKCYLKVFFWPPNVKWSLWSPPPCRASPVSALSPHHLWFPPPPSHSSPHV